MGLVYDVFERLPDASPIVGATAGGGEGGWQRR